MILNKRYSLDAQYTHSRNQSELDCIYIFILSINVPPTFSDIAISGTTFKSLSGAQTVTFTCTAKVDHDIHTMGIGPNPKGTYLINLGDWDSTTKV